MSSRVITSVAVVGMLVLASCMQDTAKAPLLPTGPSFGKNTGTCNFTTLRSDAKLYVKNLKDPLYTYIDTHQDAFKAGGLNAATTAAGWDVVWYVGTIAGTDAVGAAANGDKFLHDVFLCTTVDASNAGFAAALSENGLFAVRNGDKPNAQNAVTSRGSDVNGPFFGGERSNTGLNWQETPGPFLFYGYPITAADFATNVSVEGSAGQAFELSTLPAGMSFVYNPIKAGVCNLTAPAGSFARILHQHKVNNVDTDVILPPPANPTPAFCGSLTPEVGSLNAPTGSFAAVMHRVTSWFAPKPLYAYFGVGGSALVEDLSPIGPVTFDDTLKFVQDVPGANVSDTLRVGGQFYNPTIAVKVYSKSIAATPLAGIQVTLDVIGNNGSYLQGNQSATTGDDGIAYFTNYSINKSGGYIIKATDEFGTVTLSNQFNISGQ
jgi:hypothetical protein